MNPKTVTCSFKMDRELYNTYKSVITKKGANVKGDIIQHMINVIHSETPNVETKMEPIEEVEEG